MTYPVYISDQKIENSMDLLIISDKIKSHYLYIKDFNKFMFNKTKNKYCLQCFSSERIWEQHKEIYLEINHKQTVKLKVVLLNSKIIPDKYQLHLKFMLILTVFQKVLKTIAKQVVLIQKNIKITFLAVLLINLFVLIMNLASQLFFTGVKMQLIILLR